MDTRLAKLDRGEYTAIILAAAGLKRLGLATRIRSLIQPEDSLPAAGQGALGIEICAQRSDVAQYLSPLRHTASNLAVTAERAVSRALGGSCDIPLAAYALWQGDGQMYLRAFVASPDGQAFCRSEAKSPIQTEAEAEALGLHVAQDLIAQGALQLIPARPE